MTTGRPTVPRHSWTAALLLGTAATPAAVVIAWLAPRPLDAAAALPLVLLDLWSERTGVSDRGSRLLLLTLGIALTWLCYVLLARVLVGRLGRGDRTGRLD